MVEKRLWHHHGRCGRNSVTRRRASACSLIGVFTHQRVHTSACSRIGTAPIAIVPVDAARGAACLATAARVFWFRAVPAERVAARRRRRFVHRSPTSGRTLSFWKGFASRRVLVGVRASRALRIHSRLRMLWAARLNEEPLTVCT